MPQVWTVIKHTVGQKTDLLKGRHLHHVILCSTYSICKVNAMTPEVTFKRIIEQYKQLAGAGGGLGSATTPRLNVIKDIPLGGGGDAGVAKGREGGGKVRGDIIRFYNKVYIPVMKPYILEFKNLSEQQRAVAGVATAGDAVQVAKMAHNRTSDVPSSPTKASSTRREAGAGAGAGAAAPAEAEPGTIPIGLAGKVPAAIAPSPARVQPTLVATVGLPTTNPQTSMAAPVAVVAPPAAAS
ncbi:unnamed protein product, partial [Discosporangium mesarthrocarpum]